ncbi:MAG: serine hydrolase [Corynebacterium sp.]|uniref:serine hydrolase n=1 Tax=Corynebacterium sp. TaxID=1720 RepID=UPI0026DD2C82|nr:serine hydrolase [Corynebacterium sp.]MDO5029390.1 serine hydrolase [Corynebacterium sp.]
MRLRVGAQRKTSTLVVAALSLSTLLAGCTIDTAKDTASKAEKAVEQPKEPDNGWDTSEEIEWTDAQQVLDQAAENFSENYGIKLGVYLRVIDGPYKGLTASVGKDKTEYSASTIKAPLVVTALKKFGDQLDKTVTVDWDDAVGGSVLSVGEYTIDTLLSYVMRYSDNTAANGLIDAVGGFDAVNKTIKEAGVDESRYHMGNKFNIPNPSGDRSWFTPSQAALFMARIQEVADGTAKHKFLDQETAETALTYLTYGGSQKFVMNVGAAVQKTGDTEEGVNDHGIIYTGAGPIAYGITTRFDVALNELTDALLGQLGAQIAPLLPDYNRLGKDGKPVTPKQAAVWSADEDGDGIADRLGSGDFDDSGSANFDESLEPDWFNPFRA